MINRLNRLNPTRVLPIRLRNVGGQFLFRENRGELRHALATADHRQCQHFFSDQRHRIFHEIVRHVITAGCNPTRRERSLTFAPFYYFASAIRGETTVAPGDLSSLENNLITVEILDAARESARTGKSVIIK